MKILQAHNYYQLAGGEDTVVAQERKLLEENGHEVIPYYKHNEEIQTYSQAKKFGLVKTTTWSKNTIREVTKIIKERRIDICHVHNFLPLISPSIYSACAEMKVPVVQTLHNYRLICTNGLFLRDGVVCEECLGRSPYHSIAKKCYRDSSIQTFAVAHMLRKNTKKGTWNNLVDAYFCLTEVAKEKFCQHGIAEKLLHVKANFVDLDLSPTNEKKDYLIYVGRVEKNKGTDLLKQLALSCDHKIKVVGEGSELAELNGVQNIELLGQTDRKNTLRLIQDAKALLFPSRLYEGMPMTILEAFALKTPVIATNFGAMASMIEHQKNGLLFSLDSLNQLKENVKFALSEKKKIFEIANQAYEDYLNHYSKQANYQKIMAVYDDLTLKKMKQVLGTEMYDKGVESAIAEFLELCEQPPQNLLISPSDANVLVSARTNPDFRKIVDDFFWNLPDGMPSVWMLKLKGAKQANRISGFNFFEKAMKATKNLPINHFFCGGQENVANELIDVCKSWGNTNICGSYSPPFKDLTEEEIKAIALEVNKAKTNVLWVSLGAPKQLYFSHSISKYTNCHFIAPIGAAFDFHVGSVKKAPSWIEQSGMEWFYRLAKEPRRLFRRYFFVVPRFIYYNLIDR